MDLGLILGDEVCETCSSKDSASNANARSIERSTADAGNGLAS